MKLQFKFIIKLLIIGAISYYTIFFVYDMISSLILIFSQKVIKVNSPPLDYISLFTNEAKEKLNPIISEKVEDKNFISTFHYDKKYRIIINKINIAPDFSLKNLLIEKNSSADMSEDISYSMFDYKDFKVEIISRNVQPIKRLFFKIEPYSISYILPNDSLCFCNIKSSKVALSYDNINTNNFIISTHSKLLQEGAIPFNIAFIKKNNSLYFVCLSNMDSEKVIGDSLLPKIISY